MKNKGILWALVILLMLHAEVFAQTGASAHLQKIRNHRAELAAFFKSFPKGGDLHHHFDGSVYGETYLEIAIDKGFQVHMKTLEVRPGTAGKAEGEWVDLASVSRTFAFAELRERLLQRWSIRNFQPGFLTPEAHFFNAFMGFIPIMLADVKRGMQELKQRAIAEQVLYLESIFLPMQLPGLPASHENFNAEMIKVGTMRDEAAAFAVFDAYSKVLGFETLEQYALQHNAYVDSLHQGIDTVGFSMRYHNYVVRVFQPSQLFRDMYAAFISADASPWIVGVNIVAPEDDPVTQRDYWLQMIMYKYFHRMYPTVRYAMHAGELAPGMVKPEEMSWHIRDALAIAGASRIGHGTDLPWEAKYLDILEDMRTRQIPVEVNLSSNAFLLGVTRDAHPFMLFKQAGVPIVLSTDDAGVLRGSLTEEYMLAVQWFPEIQYEDLKEISRNGIRYGFMEPSLKAQLLEVLETKFEAFEAQYR
jgi:adenosine deaminase/adenosine deaminase CECR1